MESFLLIFFFLIPGNDFADHWEKYPWTSEWSYPVEIYSLTSSFHHFDGIRIYFVSKLLKLCVLIHKIYYQATKGKSLFLIKDTISLSNLRMATTL